MVFVTLQKRRHSLCGHLFVMIAGLLLAACGSTTANAVPTFTTGPTASPIPPSPWAQLEARPLSLPTVAPGAACPVTQGQAISGSGYAFLYGKGPAYVAVGETNGTLQYDPAPALDSGSSWGLAQIRWEVGPTFTGPLLIRGRQIDGSQSIGFNGGEGFTPTNPSGTEPIANELRFLIVQPSGNQWYRAVSFVRLKSPGCYAYQFDGASFSEVIIFVAQVN